MTILQKQFIQNNFLNFTALSAVIAFIVYGSQWQTVVNEHINSKHVHINYEDLSKQFTPRTELDTRLEIMQKALERIEIKIDNKKDK